MKTSVYLLAICALLLQSALGISIRDFAEGAGERSISPDGVTLFVTPGGTGTCTTNWANACDLQTALQAAAPGDEIWVKMGVYKPTTGADRTLSFNLESGVALYGGFAGTESDREARLPATNITTLSGDLDTGGGLDSYHVVRADEVNTQARLDGFTVTGANASDASGVEEWGGGMLVYNASPTIVDVHFIGNAAKAGGGMFIQSGAPLLIDVSFELNDATINGGGLHTNYLSSPTLTNVTFFDNWAAEKGGGMCNFDLSRPSLTGGAFTGNSAGQNGGGMYNETGSNPELTGVTFSNNEASQNGGGMYNNGIFSTMTNVSFSSNIAGNQGGGIYNTSSSLILTGVNFTNNVAELDGGGMVNENSGTGLMAVDPSLFTLTGGTFSGNIANDGDGGGMYNTTSSPILTDVTFVGNSAFLNGGGMFNTNNSNPALTGVTFSSNEAFQSGGGMYNDGSNPTLIRVTFRGNSANGHGGGIFNFLSSPRLINVAFFANHADFAGGMENFYYSNSELINVIFSGNYGNYDGGECGGMINTLSSPVLTNVTFSGNTTPNMQSGWMANYENSNPVLTNVIVWGNSPPQIYNDPNAPLSTPVIQYSDIENGSTSNHSINQDPKFVRNPTPGGDGIWGTADDDFGDLRLQFTSPAIDAGDNTAVPIDVLTDLLGLLRFFDFSTPDTGNGTPPIVDMGAYETQLVTYLTLVKK